MMDKICSVWDVSEHILKICQSLTNFIYLLGEQKSRNLNISEWLLLFESWEYDSVWQTSSFWEPSGKEITEKFTKWTSWSETSEMTVFFFFKVELVFHIIFFNMWIWKIVFFPFILADSQQLKFIFQYKKVLSKSLLFFSESRSIYAVYYSFQKVGLRPFH